MRRIDLSLYLVLDPDLCGGPTGLITTALAAAQNGATVIQLRAPQWKKRVWFEVATVLKQQLAPTGVPLIINDHADILLATDADGLHVGQSDLPAEVARQLIGSGKLLGLSTNTAAQLSAAPAALVDYVGVGPVYGTTTKKDAAETVGLAQLAAWLPHRTVPAVAIGGISAARAPEVLACGPDGIAVVSALCGQPDVAQATRQLRDLIDRSRT
ncbi:thiamine phosphate synthase [Chitinibacteraceae bacterium HSL-7]